LKFGVAYFKEKSAAEIFDLRLSASDPNIFIEEIQPIISDRGDPWLNGRNSTLSE
jgi:hypothetical protein